MGSRSRSRSRSRGRRSPSRERDQRSKSRERGSKAEEPSSKSRDRRSKSRDKRSKSRDKRSKSRERRRSRDRGGRGGRRRHSRSSSNTSWSSADDDRDRRDRDRDEPGDSGTRVHVADLNTEISKRDIEEVFSAYGEIIEVWMARSPPCFAFVVFRYREDAEKSITELDGKYLRGTHMRVSVARDRQRGIRRGGFMGRNMNSRCFQCGEPGHFSRECRRVFRSAYVRRSTRYVPKTRFLNVFSWVLDKFSSEKHLLLSV